MTCQNVTYRGRRNGSDASAETSVIVVDNERRALDRALEPVGRHSPTGFSWGYHGSGPAELALSILTDHLHGEPHPALYQDLKGFMVAEWGDEWAVSSHELAGWLQAWQRAHADAPLTVGESQGART